MSFSKTYLQKYGWKEGEGLGKTQAGIIKPVRASLKFNKEGFGYDPSQEFTDSWWLKQYNDALEGKLDQTQSGDEENEDKHKMKSRKRKKKSQKSEPEDLFEACEGRTAHKGARHGMKLSGKLQRLQEQEQSLLQKIKQQ